MFPEEYSQATTAGLTADLTLAEFPGRQFTGKLVRTSEAISTMPLCTLTAEVDVRNPTGAIAFRFSPKRVSTGKVVLHFEMDFGINAPSDCARQLRPSTMPLAR